MRLILNLLVASLLASCSLLDPENPQPTPTPTPDPVYDVVLKNDETGNKNFGPAANDLERCDFLRDATKLAKPTDTILLAAGKFDCDGKNKGTVFFPDNVSVVGQGMHKTHLYSNVFSDSQGSAFEVKNGNYSDLAFENQSYEVNEDGRTIEMFAGYKRTSDNRFYAKDANGNKIVEVANPGPFKAVFKRVKFIGTAWTVYDWSARGHHWIVEDSECYSGRQCFSMMAGGGNFQKLDLTRTKIDIDTMRSQDIGWTSNRDVGGAYGVVGRGGTINITDVEFNLKCEGTPHPASFIPRCVSIFDGNGFGSASSGWTYITAKNIKSKINGPGSKHVYDLFFTNNSALEKLKLVGGTGSGLNGTITINPIPPPR